MDKVLIPTEQGCYGYRWTDPAAPLLRNPTRLSTMTTSKPTSPPPKKSDEFNYSERAGLALQDDNLFIFEALTRVPELAEK